MTATLITVEKAMQLVATPITVAPGGCLELRPRIQQQVAKLMRELLAQDQRALFSAYWRDGAIIFEPAQPGEQVERVPDPVLSERQRLGAMSDGDLQLTAQKRGVEWDAKASRPTMVERIAAAKPADTEILGRPPIDGPAVPVTPQAPVAQAQVLVGQDAELDRLMKLSPADLELEAQKAGVDWDASLPADEMLMRIAEKNTGR